MDSLLATEVHAHTHTHGHSLSRVVRGDLQFHVHLFCDHKLHPRCPCRSQQVQGLASQTSSHDVASFVGQRHNTMRWPPAFPETLPNGNSLCYQRFTHTATPHLESSVCIVRQTLSRKVLWPTSWQPCMNLFGFQIYKWARPAWSGPGRSPGKRHRLTKTRLRLIVLV